MPKINNETLGMTAEKIICDLSELDSSRIAHRSHERLEKELAPIIENALEELPEISSSKGQERGVREGQDKSKADFACDDGRTIEVKTTKGSFKLCPHKCGQPGNDTFDDYFGHLYEGRINYDKAKTLVLNKFHEMIPIYLENLFDNDFLLFIYYTGRKSGYEIIEKDEIPNFDWKEENFSFTQTYLSWNESCTVKYEGTSIGEFQLHQHRNNYKFRFHILKLAKVLEMDRIHKI